MGARKLIVKDELVANNTSSMPQFVVRYYFHFLYFDLMAFVCHSLKVYLTFILSYCSMAFFLVFPLTILVCFVQ